MSKFELNDTVKITGNSLCADDDQIGQIGKVIEVTDKPAYLVKVDNFQIKFYWGEKDLELVAPAVKPTVFATDVTDIAREFKKGDIVRCIKASEIGRMGKVGDLYTVTDYVKNNGVSLVSQSGGQQGGLDESRFELVVSVDNSEWYKEVKEVLGKLIDNPLLKIQSCGIFDNDFSDDAGTYFDRNRKYRIKPENKVMYFCVYKIEAINITNTSALYESEEEMLENMKEFDATILQKYSIKI